MNWFTDYKDHEKLSEQLFNSDWFKELMENEQFRDAYERNYQARFRLSETKFIRKLLNSEVARTEFVNNVLGADDES